MEGEGKTIQISPEGKLEVSGAAAAAAPAAEKEAPRVVRTFEADLASVMKEKKGSVVTIALAEHRKRETALETRATAPKRNFLFLFLSLLAISGGLAFVGYVYFARDKGAATEEIAKQSGLIAAETFLEVPTGGMSQAKLIAAVNAELKNPGLRLDTIEELSFTTTGAGGKERITTERFFSLMGARVPPVLLRSFKEEFMVGVHAFNGSNAFIVLKTDFYENAFLGLLKWEQSMAAELLPFFGVRIDASNRYLLDKKFEDITVKNRDARALLDHNGDVVLLYSIPNRETVVITSAEETMDEVVRRLSASRAK
ncbi:MAG: hypothetical protein Q8Q36_02610 [bacterium]|nr:hypothetical protein [bacterium]